MSLVDQAPHYMMHAVHVLEVDVEVVKIVLVPDRHRGSIHQYDYT